MSSQPGLTLRVPPPNASLGVVTREQGCQAERRGAVRIGTVVGPLLLTLGLRSASRGRCDLREVVARQVICVP